MSLAITHFVIGATSTMVLWMLIMPYQRKFMLPTIVVGGFWAMVPDLHHIMPVYSEVYLDLIHNTILANIFWIHGILDTIDPTDSKLVASLALGYLLVITFIVGIIDYYNL